MKRNGTIFVVTILALLAAGLMACAPAPAALPPATQPQAKAEIPTAAASATPVAAKGGKLVFGISWEPASFDPHKTSSYEGAIVARMVFDSLIRQAPDGTFHPSLATNWKILDEGKAYVFELRRDVLFHDGTPFNAGAVKFSFDRIVDPATKSERAIGLIGKYKSTEIVDDYTVKVNLGEPFGPFLSGIAQPLLAMVSPAEAGKWGDTFTDHLAGTGPFIFKEWVRKDHLTVTRNPKYNWAPDFSNHQGPAYLEEILIKFVPESSVRTGTLQTGETQLINEVAPLDFKQLASNNAFKTFVIVQPGVPLSIPMNVTRPPLDDIRVRQALEYAISKQAIVDALFAGLYPQAYGPLSPSMLGYWDGGKSMYGYDPSKAKSLLEEAGWKLNASTGIREKNGTVLSLRWPTFTWQRMNEMATIVQAQLKEVGVDLKVEVVAFPALYKAANSCEHNLSHFGPPGMDPDVLSLVLSSAYVNSGSGNAFTCVKDPKIDALLTQGRTSVNEKARVAAYTELQKIVMENAFIVPIREFTTLAAVRAEVKDVQFDPLGFAPLFYDMYVQK